MKLSAAILLGSTLSPQAFAEFEDDNGSRCALGAALAAIGNPIQIGNGFRAAAESWPWIEPYGEFHCPDCDGVASQALSLIVHINDGHKWTRERIAEWVATVEPQDIQGEQTDEVQGARIAVLEATEA
jgi:hypothetical protein